MTRVLDMFMRAAIIFLNEGCQAAPDFEVDREVFMQLLAEMKVNCPGNVEWPTSRPMMRLAVVRPTIPSFRAYNEPVTPHKTNTDVVEVAVDVALIQSGVSIMGPCGLIVVRMRPGARDEMYEQLQRLRR